MSLGTIAELGEAGLERFFEAAKCTLPVCGLTHGFYRYPARFSPQLVRTAITVLSRPGDVVLDPFMGGGTTLVEARYLGRKGVGCDISGLAWFVSVAKTTLYTKQEIASVRRWGRSAADWLKIRTPPTRRWRKAAEHYPVNISTRSTWRIRNLLALGLLRSDELKSPRARRLARCVLLKTGQWALDSRKVIPTVATFRSEMLVYLEEILAGAREFRAGAKAHLPAGFASRDLLPIALCRSAAGLEKERAIQNLRPPALILTSPPYPGVHVLYHRWQIRGRRETPAPFWVAGLEDGHGTAYFTFGDRRALGLAGYFENLEQTFRSVAAIAGPRTLMVQVVAFNKPNELLQQYLRVMNGVGFQELLPFGAAGSSDGRLRRTVPNRKWYADQRGTTPSAQEVILFHRLSR